MKHLGVMALLSTWLVVASLPVGATTTQAGALSSKAGSAAQRALHAGDLQVPVRALLTDGTGTGTGSSTVQLQAGTHVNNPADVAATRVVSPASSPLWDLQRDFRTEPQQANPETVNYGYGIFPIWRFGDAITHALPQFIDDAFGIKGLEQWQSPSSSSPTNGLPAIGINATGTVQRVAGLVWPANVIRVHPSPTAKAIITWTSPATFTTTLAVSEKLTDLDPTCGTGISYYMVKISPRSPSQGTVLAQGVLLNGGTQSYQSNNISILQNDMIALEIGALNGDVSCDSTGVQLSIG